MTFAIRLQNDGETWWLDQHGRWSDDLRDARLIHNRILADQMAATAKAWMTSVGSFARIKVVLTRRGQ